MAKHLAEIASAHNALRCGLAVQLFLANRCGVKGEKGGDPYVITVNGSINRVYVLNHVFQYLVKSAICVSFPFCHPHSY